MRIAPSRPRRSLGVPVVLSGQTLIAMAACGVAIVVLYRSIFAIDRIVRWLGVIVGLTLVLIIVAGFTHFDAHRAFDFPAGAFHLNGAFFAGLGAGTLISAYDYWGYYNVCFLGAEVRDPQRTIPRAVLGAIGIVGTLYLLMNISVLGAPWREMAQCHLPPRQTPQHADVHQQVKRSDDPDGTQHCARNRPLRIADLRSQEANVVVAPVVIRRDQHPSPKPGKERSIEVKRTCGKVKCTMSIEVRKSRDDNQHQRQPNDHSQPTHDAINGEDAAIQNHYRDSTSSHRDQRLPAQHHRNAKQRVDAKG